LVQKWRNRGARGGDVESRITPVLVRPTVGRCRLRIPITIPQRPPVPSGVPDHRCGWGRKGVTYPRGYRTTVAAGAARVSRNPQFSGPSLRLEPQRALETPCNVFVFAARGEGEVKKMCGRCPQCPLPAGTPGGMGGRCGMVIGILRRRPRGGYSSVGGWSRGRHFKSQDREQKNKVANPQCSQQGETHSRNFSESCCKPLGRTKRANIISGGT